MKKNFKRSIVQKGGLMIEALAMLGLIAVVTPTMYKKSAERTLEVEDINTADTIRSYMTATEAYMAANYRNIMEEMTDGKKRDKDGNVVYDENGNTVYIENFEPKTLKILDYDEDGLADYMPYGFNNGKALYDYGKPKIAIVRQESNLTAFILFPAKVSGGLGQERTSRIASLVGANSGYIKAEGNAHGVGGVWNLSKDEVKEFFGEENSPNELSLVTASSNVINSTSGAGAVENTKYLQRTSENTNEKWRNAMRTDLYMGGGDEKADPDDREHVENHNILNINSLIVGADADMEDGYNGLYIAQPRRKKVDANGEAVKDSDGNEVWEDIPGSNINAYIAGTLTAATENLFVSGNTLGFGKDTYKQTQKKKDPVTGEDTGEYEEVDVDDYYFKADKYGNLTSLTGKDGSGYLHLGELNISKGGKVEASHFIKADAGGVEVNNNTEPYASVSLLNDDIFQLTTSNKEIPNEIDYGAERPKIAVEGTHVLIEGNGFKGADNASIEGLGQDSAGNNIGPKYSGKQTFPVVVGSNMMVKGVMSAGQVDAQHMRTASFSSGSENIDDEHKWIKIDKEGIEIQDIKTKEVPAANENEDSTQEYDPDGTYMKVKTEGIEMGTGTTNNASIKLDKHQATKNETVGEEGNQQTQPVTRDYGDITLAVDNEESKITTQNTLVAMQMQGSDIRIDSLEKDTIQVANGENNENTTNIEKIKPYRVIVNQGGDVDLLGSNLKVMDEDNKNILTVRGNKNREEADNKDNYNDFNTDYNITAHGKVLFSSISGKAAGDIASDTVDDTSHYMAIGMYDKKAGVNIVPGTEEEDVNVEPGGNNDDNKTNNEQVIFVDLSTKSNNSYVKTSYENGNTTTELVNNVNNSPEEHDIAPGAIYVRKGMMEIVPDPDNVRYKDDKSIDGANDGSGIIRASRFIANNIDAKGKQVKVPQLLTDDAYARYYGDENAKTYRYDTYMVNPAYTSVMKDIKLTTRGGARLSDILPDFIQKGVYYVNNTYDDIYKVMKFQIDEGSDNPNKEFDVLINDGNGGYVKPQETTRAENGSDYIPFASPYSGPVPAPQCPPGYAKVVTITPWNFEMGRAGRLAYSGVNLQNGSYMNDYTINPFYVDYMEGMEKLSGNLDDVFDNRGDTLTAQSLISARNPFVANLQNDIKSISGVSDSTTSLTYNDGTKVGGTIGDIKISGTKQTNKDGSDVLDEKGQPVLNNIASGDVKVTSVKSYKNMSNDGNGFHGEGFLDGKVLAVRDDGLLPFNFQQNTNYKSEAVPLANGEIGQFGVTPNGYTRGWAVLMGFLYDSGEYYSFIRKGENTKVLADAEEGGDKSVAYWNLFPVYKQSLMAWANTYCYLDRENAMSPDFRGTSPGNPFGGADSEIRIIDGKKVIVPYNTRIEQNDDEYDDVVHSMDRYYGFHNVPSDYEKGKIGNKVPNQKYYDQLNDPTMKYNEVW